jgi:hypothetical protein
MSVIGRLDDQVEKVIIAPIARRHDEQHRVQEEAGKPQTSAEDLQRETAERQDESE